MPYILKEHITKSEDIKQTYISKHNLKRENEVISSRISDLKKLHYHTVKSLLLLMRSIRSKNNSGFCGLNCLHLF